MWLRSPAWRRSASSVIEPSYNPLAGRPRPATSPLPNHAWALFIDGASRTVAPLVAREYFVASDQGGASLVLTNSPGERSLVKMVLTSDNDLELETLRAGDAGPLVAMLKFEDRRYVALEIPPGLRVTEVLKDVSGSEYAAKMTFCFGELRGRRICS
jgi:hypothetical protein